MTVLILGASGATGRLVLQHFLERKISTKIILRPQSHLSDQAQQDPLLTVIRGSILDFTDVELAVHVKGCHSIISCLGHKLSFKGIFGQPRKLVTEACERLCSAIQSLKPEKPVKFVLMNTAGNRNLDLTEAVSFAQRSILCLLRVLIPPHKDNEDAANLLRTKIGQSHNSIEWIVVRPDTLVDSIQVSKYDLHPSPTRSAIFDPGTTSRINVAHFMVELVLKPTLWDQWRGQMPIIYNCESAEKKTPRSTH
ncbi:MAG: NAD(P)H-binding protein [Planctomycetota bacterium]|nr:NAD(P)H-binding protein [Planctomycetota bacterium]